MYQGKKNIVEKRLGPGRRDNGFYVEKNFISGSGEERNLRGTIYRETFYRDKTSLKICSELEYI